MFPFEDEEILEEIEEELTPREYEIDFKTGKLTGKIVEGAKAVAMWCWMALLTQRYRYYTYSWMYGSELEELIGKNHSQEYLDTELKRMIEDCLLINEYVEEVKDLSYNQQGNVLHVKFKIVTTLGEEVVESNV